MTEDRCTSSYDVTCGTGKLSGVQKRSPRCAVASKLVATVAMNNAEASRQPPTVLSLFLVKFDVRKGNSLVWSRRVHELEDDAELLQSVEFKAMPSRLHARESDTVYFAQGHHSYGHLEGLAVFRQNGFSADGQPVSRDDVQIYSLGVLVQRKLDEPTKIWAFASELDSMLQNYMRKVKREDIRQYELYLEFEEFFKRSPASFDLTHNHPILAVTELFNLYGPLVFEIWKQTMLRKRVLLVDSNGSRSIEEYCQFVYILSVLGTIPSDLEVSAPDPEVMYSCPLYCVTISDIEWLKTHKHYVAFTTDEVLLDKEDLYDVAIVTRPNGQPSFVPRPARPTVRDSRRFRHLVESLQIPIEDSRRPQTIVEQAKTIVRSFFSEDTLYGFLWWASAGEQTALETSTDELDDLLLLDYNKGRNSSDMSDAVTESEPWEISAFGYFHQLTRRLFQTIGYIIANQDMEHGSDLFLLAFELPDLFEMGLDPYSDRDVAFLVEFVRVWWSRTATVHRFFKLPCC